MHMIGDTGLENAPTAWKVLLEVVGLYWQPMIAGGCIRDYIIGLPAKDIDIVVPASSDEDFLSIIKSLSSRICHGSVIWLGTNYIWGEEGADWCAAHNGEYGLDAAAPDLVGVWEGEILGYPCNIIGRESIVPKHGYEAFSERAARLVDTFDFDILQFAFSSEGYFSHELASRACHSRTATLRHNRSYHQSLARFDRFSKRNPNCKVWLKDPFKETVYE